jgi:putative OPT family oligopeptide transporter
MAGSLITQMKISYWIGSTPKKLQWANVFGSIFAAIVTAGVIMLLAKVHGFTPSPEHTHPLPAPQANAMAAVIKSVMSGQAPWFLYAIGAMIAILIKMLNISPLAFALGMYLPLEINFPMLIGAVVSWLVTKSAKKDEKKAAKYNERGTLVSSGVVAGAAIIGVIGSLVQWLEQSKGWNILGKIKETIIPTFATDDYWRNWLGLLFIIILCVYMFWDARRVKD